MRYLDATHYPKCFLVLFKYIVFVELLDRWITVYIMRPPPPFQIFSLVKLFKRAIKSFKKQSLKKGANVIAKI